MATKFDPKEFTVTLILGSIIAIVFGYILGMIPFGSYATIASGVILLIGLVFVAQYARLDSVNWFTALFTFIAIGIAGLIIELLVPSISIFVLSFQAIGEAGVMGILLALGWLSFYWMAGEALKKKLKI